MYIHNRTLYGKEEKYTYHIYGCQVSNKIDLATRKRIVHKGVKYLKNWIDDSVLDFTKKGGY